MPQKNNTVQYDNFGETFGKSRQNLHWEEIDILLSRFVQEGNLTTGLIADIGCGNGRLLRHIGEHQDAALLGEKISHYVGIDASRVLIHQAQLADWSDIVGAIDWHIGDMRDANMYLAPYGLFDCIFFIASFHHLLTSEERLSVIIETKKYLSLTGKIMMTNWNLLDPSQIKYRNSKIAEYPDGSADYSIKIGENTRFYHAFSEAEYRSLAEAAGCRVDITFGERNSTVIFY